ncbi:Mov34/MPN/PAD-1 family protein [Granulicella arctica]|uniref:Proteasome lid subunit RPN8/RPN11 n=1 Tax=Granulicella arctica TaxID=940613 RepID=A0A7Y9TF86_9BACT|nr:Mov34/MPN/PAD-1 family protein [Granulicella arctica]NYF78069.1 proteasome lid subunit RPN8/RPN11 [Granulicella arctica]
MTQPAKPSIQIDAEVTRQIRQHARSSMATEVCGVLIGDLLPGSETDVAIFAAIAGVNAAQAGTHVTFTQDAWEHIYKVKDADYPDARIVGWYHSHPGFGVFLSEHDTFIQQNFFSAPNQVAWVFDPHSDEEGCFGWVDGNITRLTSINLIDRDTPANVSESRDLTPSEDLDLDADSDTLATRRTAPPPRWLRWSATASALLATLILGFALSHFLFPSPYLLALPINPLTAQPLLRDPKTGDPVYIDPQGPRYVTLDSRTGKLTVLDPNALRAAQPPTALAPDQAPQPPATPDKTPPAQEKK